MMLFCRAPSKMVILFNRPRKTAPILSSPKGPSMPISCGLMRWSQRLRASSSLETFCSPFIAAIHCTASCCTRISLCCTKGLTISNRAGSAILDSIRRMFLLTYQGGLPCSFWRRGGMASSPVAGIKSINRKRCSLSSHVERVWTRCGADLSPSWTSSVAATPLFPLRLSI